MTIVASRFQKCGFPLAMPAKRYTRRPVDFLDRDEIEALLEVPDMQTRAGRRDHTLILVAVQSGLRASGVSGLRWRPGIMPGNSHSPAGRVRRQ